VAGARAGVGVLMDWKSIVRTAAGRRFGVGGGAL
jgi:hypothetical protein